MSVIDVSNVRKTYDEVTAVDSLNLTVEEGELYGFLGHNGAGKTTTIGILTGQIEPDTGSVNVLGTDPVANPVATRNEIGILPERESPPSYLTPREYFQFVGESRGLSEQAIANGVEEWASNLKFEEQLDTLHTDLSQGQKQKVMITQCFLHSPDLVFIDEPLANLDPIIQEKVKDYFEQYRKDGNTLFLSTHHTEVAEEICTTTGILSDGQLVTEQRPDDLGNGESLLDHFPEHSG